MGFNSGFKGLNMAVCNHTTVQISKLPLSVQAYWKKEWFMVQIV